MITDDQLINWFSYHAPESKEQTLSYENLRSAGLAFAQVIRNLTPESADQTAAIHKVREAVMTANAAIACDGQ